MSTLLLDGILPHNAKLVSSMNGANPVMSVALTLLMLSFIIFTTLTVMNMLLGVLVEVVNVVASTEKEGMAVSAVNYELKEAMLHLGHPTDATAIITKTQFLELLSQPEVASILQSVGVDVLGLMDMSDVIFEDKAADHKATCQHVRSDVGNIVGNFVSNVAADREGLTFADFVEVILNMRGTNPATVKDVEKQIKVMKSTVKGLLEEMYDNVTKHFDQLREGMSDLHLNIQDLQLESDFEDSD